MLHCDVTCFRTVVDAAFDLLETHIWYDMIQEFDVDSRLSVISLKMIGKGFVLFEINSSPSAFYIIKPTCIVIGF